MLGNRLCAESVRRGAILNLNATAHAKEALLLEPPTRSRSAAEPPKVSIGRGSQKVNDHSPWQISYRCDIRFVGMGKNLGTAHFPRSFADRPSLGSGHFLTA